jgi:hypothetical protein
MTVEFNHTEVMQHFEKKRKKFLTMTGEMGASLAAINSRVDTGASQSAKRYELTAKDTVIIEAPLEYDVYLERKYGVLAKTEHQLIPYMAKFEEDIF